MESNSNNEDRSLSSGLSADSPDTRKKSVRHFFQWHEPGASKEEKWLIFKLDFFILTYTCLV